MVYSFSVTEDGEQNVILKKAKKGQRDGRMLSLHSVEQGLNFKISYGILSLKGLSDS